MKPCILVTGGHGFIGAWVLRELRRHDCRIVVLDLNPQLPAWARWPELTLADITVVPGELMTPNLLERTLEAHPISHVIHLIGLLTPACQQNPVRGAEVNVLGTLRLFELLRTRRAQLQGVSYASSYAVHGPTGETRSHPETFYGVYKRTVEMLADQYWRHFGISSVGLRPYVVYGAGREVGISAGPSLAARAAAFRQPYVCPFTGRVGLVFVEDVARAFVRCALATPQGAHAIDMPGEEVEVDELLDALEEIRPGSKQHLSASGPPLPATREEQPHLLNRLFADWQDTPWREGLRRTVYAWESAGC
jgi:nucleoside-diphosphate-sugar epimerase